MEMTGVEPVTSCLQSRRSTWLSYIPEQATGRPSGSPCRLRCLGFPEASTQAASVRGQQGSHVEQTGLEPVTSACEADALPTELQPPVVVIAPGLEPGASSG